MDQPSNGQTCANSQEAHGGLSWAAGLHEPGHSSTAPLGVGMQHRPIQVEAYKSEQITVKVSFTNLGHTRCNFVD